MAKKGADISVDVASAETPNVNAGSADSILLFATKTCPNCKVAKTYLDKAGVPYTTVYADENVEITEKYEIRQAPTLVLVQGDCAEKIVNLSNIKKFSEEYTK